MTTPDFDTTQLENILLDFLAKQKGPFKLADVLYACKNKTDLKCDHQKELEERLVHILDYQEVFHDPITGKYQVKSTFFKGAKFLVTPTPFEIENGILFPGHRFSPFFSEDIFPCEIKLIPQKGKRPLKASVFPCKLEVAVPYHLLLGSEEMFNYFIADHEDNGDILNPINPDGELKLSVFDFAGFYQKNSFSPGDALSIKILDWNQGKAEVSYLAEENRDSAKKQSQWLTMFETALEGVFDKFDDYLEVPEQFAQAFFQGKKQLLEKPAISIDEFQSQTENIQLRMSNGRTVLGRKVDAEIDNDQGSSELPEGLTASQGNTESLEAILREAGSSLQNTEVEGFMRDELFRGEGSFDNFCERCFGKTWLAEGFADDLQQAAFMNFIEEIWEELVESYDFADDVEKGPLRASILDLTEERVQWLEELQNTDFDQSRLPEKEFEALVKCSHHLASILNLLNSKQPITPEDADQLGGQIADIGEVQSALLDRINSEIKG